MDGDGRAGRNVRSRTPPHKFHRAYKACIKCRSRKTRCDITAEEYSAGLPCSRCRREMKECTFPTERHATTPKQRQAMRRAAEQKAPSPNSDQPTISVSLSAADEEELPQSLSSDKEQRPAAQQQYGQQLGTSLPTKNGAVRGTAASQIDNDSVMPTSVADSMMRTVVSNGEDALNLLFEAAHHDRTDMTNHSVPSTTDMGGGTTGPTPMQDSLQPGDETRGGTSPVHSSLYGSRRGVCAMSSNVSDELAETWKAYRFVRMGWLSAEEAITYVDLFFQNMAPLTPILDDFYAHHANHYWLVVREPMLCCMILCISSRYHALPVPGGESRGYLIHQRFWDHLLHLLMRIILGQEKGSKAKTRTLGSIEALLLMCEWQPRGLHVPPVGDGWDSDALFTLKDQRDENAALVDSPSRSRWREDVINPARRFDRMSWMVLGVAVTLASELGVFDSDEPSAEAQLQRTLPGYERRLLTRRAPLATVLFTYQELWSSRLGRKSIMSQSIIHSIHGSMHSPAASGSSLGLEGPRWRSFMLAWTELTKLTRSISDMLFPSALITKHLLQSGRYIGMIEHFMSLLATWENKYLNASVDSESHFGDVLYIEYQNTRAYASSLGIQAIVERTMSEPGEQGTRTPPDLSPTDYGFVTTVVDSCLEILKLATKLHARGALRFAPVSIFLRITTASVFLLKGLGLGVNGTKLRDAHDVLTQAIAALRSSRPDDLHLGSRYATLLEMHVVRLQRNFVPAARPPPFATRPSSVERRMTLDDEGAAGGLSIVGGVGGGGGAAMAGLGGMPFGDDCNGMNEAWLTLPFDPSLLPFAPDEFQDFQGLGDNSMDFIWNLGA